MSNRRRPRLCRACGKLIGSENTVCPYCGRKETAFDGFFDPLFRHTEFARVFLFANIAIYIVVYALSRSRGVREFEILYLFGLLDPAAVFQGEIWRLLNPVFLHLGVLHLAMNGFYLFQIGPDVEAGYGKEKFVVIYLVAGVVGNLGSIFFGLGGAGASGALFGLAGAYIAFGMRSRQPDVTKRALAWAATLFLLGLVMGNRINHYAHFFGLVGGWGAAYVLGFREETSFLRKRVIQAVAVFLLALVPLCFGIAIYRGFS